MTNGDNGSGGGDVSRDLDTDEHIKDPVEDRRTLAERNERLHDQLKVWKRHCRQTVTNLRFLCRHWSKIWRIRVTTRKRRPTIRSIARMCVKDETNTRHCARSEKETRNVEWISSRTCKAPLSRVFVEGWCKYQQKKTALKLYWNIKWATNKTMIQHTNHISNGGWNVFQQFFT